MTSNSYIICSTPRTGSTLLCSLLKSTGVAGYPESYFRIQDRINWAKKWGVSPDRFSDFLNAATTAGTSENGVFSARVMWGSMMEIIKDIQDSKPLRNLTDVEVLEHAFGPIKFVYLKRLNIVAQAVSRLRAEQTDIWHILDDKESSQTDKEPKYDFEQLHGYVEEAKSHNLAWEEWFSFNATKPHLILYEDLQKDPTMEILRILEYLEISVPDGCEINAKNKRLADKISEEWIERYNLDSKPPSSG
ncbi:MAG: sulfotransferase [Rhodospirillales bacterium]|nr:sulfotransferase [Rhodospirillales bacterium]